MWSRTLQGEPIDSPEKRAAEKVNENITYEYGLCSMHGRWLAPIRTDVETFRVNSYVGKVGGGGKLKGVKMTTKHFQVQWLLKQISPQHLQRLLQLSMTIYSDSDRCSAGYDLSPCAPTSLVGQWILTVLLTTANCNCSKRFMLLFLTVSSYEETLLWNLTPNTLTVELEYLNKKLSDSAVNWFEILVCTEARCTTMKSFFSIYREAKLMCTDM